MATRPSTLPLWTAARLLMLFLFAGILGYGVGSTWLPPQPVEASIGCQDEVCDEGEEEPENWECAEAPDSDSYRFDCTDGSGEEACKTEVCECLEPGDPVCNGN